CKVTACTTKRKWESEYCRDHGCETPGCEKGREMSGNFCQECTEEIETVRKERRKCERTGCEERRLDMHPFCRKCQEGYCLGCGGQKEKTNKYLCKECKCGVEGCERNRASYQRTCYECDKNPFKCKTKDCIYRKEDTGEYCKECETKECGEKGCENSIPRTGIRCGECEKRARKV